MNGRVIPRDCGGQMDRTYVGSFRVEMRFPAIAIGQDLTTYLRRRCLQVDGFDPFGRSAARVSACIPQV